MSAEQPGAKPPHSAVELQKENSHFLRGSIADELGKEVDHFGDADKNLLKFHGTYQQEDRDAARPGDRAASANTICSWFAARFPAVG